MPPSQWRNTWNLPDQREEETTEEDEKEERVERRKVVENEDPKFGKERSRAKGETEGRVMKIDQEIREEGGEQMRRKTGERKKVGEEKRWLDFKEAADSKVDHLFMDTAY